jgi:hypothetical protein
VRVLTSVRVSTRLMRAAGYLRASVRVPARFWSS